MTKPLARDPVYRGRVFGAEIIELCVRWYMESNRILGVSTAQRRKVDRQV
jgi:hypothetical protein